MTTSPDTHPLAQIVLHRAVLFHGSTTPGITAFEPAEDDTVGHGVYLADERVAQDYARHRSARTPEPAIVYELGVERARLVDLTDQNTCHTVMTGFRTVLHHELLDHSTTGRSWHWAGALRRMIEAIDTGAAVDVGTIKHATRQSGELFTRYLSELGFDGVYTVEGGEGAIGHHATYLLFDPTALTVRAEHDLSQSSPPAPAVAPAPAREHPGSSSVLDEDTLAQIAAATAGTYTATGVTSTASGRRAVRNPNDDLDWAAAIAQHGAGEGLSGAEL